MMILKTMLVWIKNKLNGITEEQLDKDMTKNMFLNE